MTSIALPVQTFFHGSPYYFASDADLQKAIELDKECGLDVAGFQDELDLAGILWAHQDTLPEKTPHEIKMKELQGTIGRFFYDPSTATALFRMKGDDELLRVRVPENVDFKEELVLTKPGDEVKVEINTLNAVTNWYNKSYCACED